MNIRRDFAVRQESTMCLSTNVWIGCVNDGTAALFGRSRNDRDHDVHDQALDP
jgi:hypothetical protein